MGGIWKAAFSFRGEATRRDFLLGAILVFGATLAAGVAILIALNVVLLGLRAADVISVDVGRALNKVTVSVTVLLIAAPYIWTLFALAAKRARNAGFPVAPFLLAWLFAGPLDAWLLRPLVESRYLWPFQKMTPVGGTVSALMLLLLIAWPPRRGAKTKAEAAAAHFV
jgi:uncharacterized membrane protein YhaH (DUF805 family)